MNKNNAIKISSVDAEYDYLDNLLGEWKLVEQSVLVEDDMVYDVLEIESKNKLHTFWFDITSFYGI